MTPTIAIIAAGAMGSAVAERLTRRGATVLTSLDGRSQKSRARAEAAATPAAAATFTAPGRCRQCERSGDRMVS